MNVFCEVTVIFAKLNLKKSSQGVSEMSLPRTEVQSDNITIIQNDTQLLTQAYKLTLPSFPKVTLTKLRMQSSILNVGLFNA